MKSGEIAISGGQRRCFFFKVRFDKKDANGEPLKQVFYIVTPDLKNSRKEAFLYLSQVLWVSKLYTSTNRLYRIFIEEFNSVNTKEEFLRIRKDLFDVWELRRSTEGLQILHFDETSARKAVLYRRAAQVSAAAKSVVPFMSEEEIVMSNMNSEVEFKSKQECSTFSHSLNCDFSEQEKASSLEQESRAKAILPDELERRKSENVYSQKRIELKKEESSNGCIKTSQLDDIIRENAEAIKTIEASFKKREEELHKLYQEALQSRDIQIVQLTDTQIKYQQQHDMDVFLIGQLKKELELRKNESFNYERCVGPSTTSTTQLQLQLKELEIRYLLLAQNYKSNMDHQIQLEGEVRCAKTKIVSQQLELENASLLIQSLKDGLQFVKQSISQLNA